MAGMNPFDIRFREKIDLLIITGIAILFSSINISLQFMESIYIFLYQHFSLEVARYISNFVFLYLAGLLLLTFRRWRIAEKKRRELENIIQSISPDVLLVVDGKRRIVLCNPLIEKMFGYTVDDVMHQKVDMLYAENETYSERWDEVCAILGTEGFHIETATGKRKNGDIFYVEIITGNLGKGKGAVMLFRDITKRKKAEELINRAYTELTQVFNKAADGMCVIDKDYTVVKANATMAHLLNVSEEEILNRKCYEVLSCKRYMTQECGLTVLMNSPERIEYEISLERTDGVTVPCILAASTFRDPDGTPIGIIESYRDITERKRYEATIEALSITDELTGLYNRRGFMTLVEQQIRISERTRRGILIIFADINNMKTINDTFGHMEGDNALRDAAMIFRNTLRKSEIIARIGGDEFAIAAIETPEEHADIVIDHIQNNFALHNAHAEKPYELSVTTGTAYFNPASPATIEELLDRADKNMYARKMKPV